MAGYSGTPLAKKLGLKNDLRMVLLNEPADFVASLGPPLPEGCELLASWETAEAPIDWAIVFTTEESVMREAIVTMVPRLRANGQLWLAWPKKASKIPTDLAFDVVQGLGLGSGLVDNKICAVDETWSGLRFVVRKDARTAWPVQ